MAADDQLPLPLRRDAVCDAEAAPFRRLDQYRLPAEFTDAELLTAVLGSSSRASCDALTAAHEDFRAIGQLIPTELTGHGFTANAISRLVAVFEIAKRYGEREFKLGAVFRGSGDIYAHFRERMATEICELFYAVLLDNKHRKLREVLVSKGSLTAAIVHPRDVFAQVVRFSAAAIVLVHNHPSGVMRSSGLCGVDAAVLGPVRVCEVLDSA